MKKSFLFPVFCLCLLAGCTTTKHATNTKQQVQSKRYHLYKKFETKVGYSQAVRTGRMLYISGTAASANIRSKAVLKAYKQFVPDTAAYGAMSKAAFKVYEQLKRTLNENGLSFANVVKENVYTTNLDAFKQNEVLRKKFYKNKLPAATWVQVDRLFRPDLVLEVELVAVYPE